MTGFLIETNDKIVSDNAFPNFTCQFEQEKLRKTDRFSVNNPYPETH